MTYDQDPDIQIIKEILEKESNKFLIDEILKAYWQYPEFLLKSKIYKKFLNEKDKS